MRYFFLNLFLHTLVFIILLVLMSIFFKRNKRRKTARPFTYFVPCLLALLACLDMAFFAGPRILDIVNVVSERYMIHTGKLEEISVCRNVIKIDGSSFFINPKADLPEVGTNIKIKYTENSNYVMEMAANTVADASSSDK